MLNPLVRDAERRAEGGSHLSASFACANKPTVDPAVVKLTMQPVGRYVAQLQIMGDSLTDIANKLKATSPKLAQQLIKAASSIEDADQILNEAIDSVE